MECSYEQLASKCRIIIPSLQRAYAQGRDTKLAKEIRNKFITDIKEALDKKNKLSLETVYGEWSGDVFTPLDGQQRLTTLFLLHLYLARYTEQPIEKIRFLTDEAGKSKFRYATRTSSEDFCEYLIKKDFTVDHAATGNIIPPSFDEKNQEKEGITQRIIKSDMDFQWTWYNDPTIAAMLNMFDTIHAQFYQDAIKYQEYYNALTDNVDPLVTFWFQKIEKAIPADELYVRMNARGLALTEFENHKAALLHFLGSDENPTGNAKKNIEKIKKNIDSEWQEAIWNYCKVQLGNPGIGTAKAVDTILLRILHVCILFELMKKYLSSGGEAADDAEKRKRAAAEKAVANFIQTTKFDQYELNQCEYYRNLEPAEKESLSREIIRMMNLTVTEIKQNRIRNFELADILDVKVKKFSYEFILDFYVRYYLVPIAGGNAELYDVLRRLIKYTKISGLDDFEREFNALLCELNRELEPNAEGFLQEFRKADDPERFVHNGFAKNQTWEEHLKLRMKENSEWKRSIETTENDTFFDGQILFLFECLLNDDDDLANIDAADKTCKLMRLVDGRDDPELRNKFDTYFEICRYAFAEGNSNILRKLLMLQAISKNVGQNSLPVYPFTPEYAEEWPKNQSLSLVNKGSMILDQRDNDQNWKRMLRIDLSNQKQDKPAYRKLIRTVVKAACAAQGDTVADRMKSLLNELRNVVAKEIEAPLAAGQSEPPNDIFRSVRETLLEWCLRDDWGGYYNRGIRLSDHRQLYLLTGNGERLRDNYQELHMMLMKAHLVGNPAAPGYDFPDDHDQGRLTIQPDGAQEKIQLEYYDGKVRGHRGQTDSKDDSWEYCEYTTAEIINLINKLNNAGVVQTPPAGGGANAPA